jgi:hypothetical protein
MKKNEKKNNNMKNKNNERKTRRRKTIGVRSGHHHHQHSQRDELTPAFLLAAYMRESSKPKPDVCTRVSID